MKSCSVIGVVVGSIAAAMTLAAGTSPDKAGAFNAGNVSEARVLAESGNGNNWLVNGGNFGSQHFSPLRQIDDKNIGKLGLAWSLDLDSPMGMASEPIVVDGTIYVSGSLDRVFAVDAVSGKVLWKYDPHVRLSVMRNSATARTNRGVAVWEGMEVQTNSPDIRQARRDIVELLRPPAISCGNRRYASIRRNLGSPALRVSATARYSSAITARIRECADRWWRSTQTPENWCGGSGMFREIRPKGSTIKRSPWPRRLGLATNGGWSAAATCGIPLRMTVLRAC